VPREVVAVEDEVVGELALVLVDLEVRGDVVRIDHGEVEPGLWMAAGFGGHGTMPGPVLGRLLAKMIAGKPDPTIDISELHPRRAPGSVEEWMVAAKKGG